MRLDLQTHWDAFYDLTTERQSGMGIGSITSSKIRQYIVEEMELDGDEGDRFFTIIRRMDDEYVSMANTTDKTNSKIENEVSVDDVHGTRQLFRNIDARKKSIKQNKAANNKTS